MYDFDESDFGLGHVEIPSYLSILTYVYLQKVITTT